MDICMTKCPLNLNLHFAFLILVVIFLFFFFTVFLNVSHSIRVDVNEKPENITETITTTTATAVDLIDESNVTLLADDSELSASERTRRLIPYMAFYLPVSELTINKQYASLPPQASKHSLRTNSGNAGILNTSPTASHVPIPTAYVHMKMNAMSAPSATSEGVEHYVPPSASANYQINAGTGYYDSNIGGHSLTAVKQIADTDNNKYSRVVDLVPLRPPELSVGVTHSPLVRDNDEGKVYATHRPVNPHKQKTVQYFPPLSSQTSSKSSLTAFESLASPPKQIIRSRQQQNHAAYRTRSKPSKNNLTPFTASNTVPGDFVPIVYTPANSNSNNNLNNIITNTAGADDTAHIVLYDDENDEISKHYQQQTQQTQPRQQIAVEYSASLPPIDVQSLHNQNYHHRYRQQQQQQQHNSKLQQQQQPKQQAYFSITTSTVAAELAPENTVTISPPIRHHIGGHNDAVVIHQQQGLKSTQFQPPKAENFFITNTQQEHHNPLKVKPPPPPPSQRIRYKYHPQLRQQQLVSQQKYRVPSKERDQTSHKHSMTEPQVLILSSTSPPVESVSVSTQYPQNTFIRHASYNHPDLSMPPNRHLDSTGNSALPTYHQVLTIPVRNLFREFDGPTISQPGGQSYHKQQHQQSTHRLLAPSSPPSLSSASLHASHYPTAVGPSTPQYIDYLIDEPKQSLDEEQHAYFVVTTPSAPNSHHDESIRTKENYDPTLRTIYKTKPVLHLQQTIQPKKNVNHPLIRYKNPIARPMPATPTPSTVSLKPTAKFVYVKEEFGQKLVPSQGLFKTKQTAASVHYNNNANNAKIPEEQLQKQDLTTQSLSPQRNEVKQHHSSSTLADPNELPDIRTSSLAEILHKLQESNHLPHTLTPDNIDNSIKTLIHILNNLKQTQTIVPNPPQHHELPPHSPDYDYSADSREQQQQQDHHDVHDLNLLPIHMGTHRQPGPSTGRPGIDYPNYADIPETSFDCSQQRYKGFFGDPETHCQVWHYCDLNGGKASFLCPNGTIFSQIALTCDWWFNVKCATTAQLYVLNERLYKYILPFTPKFPEDYSGPLVDKYLALKFQEMEEKMRLEKEKADEEAKDTNTSDSGNDNDNDNDGDDGDDDVDNINTEREDAGTEEPITEDNKSVQKHDTINSIVSEQSSERNLLIDDEVNDISQRDKSMNAFESTTISTITITPKSNEELSLNLRPIVVSSTAEPDYGDDEDANNGQDKLADASTDRIEIRKAENNNNETVTDVPQTKSEDKLNVTVEKVEIIEIKSDGTSGHIIPDTIMNKNRNN
uniref:Chitin-binding type-2 domain-containing protein n=1 Tax=Glossina pallidipes TaxID=7398 RepID=A0A1A9ZE93_GLOPL